MPQFGATTTITSDVRLIILDCFETLVELDGTQYRPRNGVPAFLEHYTRTRPTTLVVASDTEREVVNAALDQAGLVQWFAAVYHLGNAIEHLGGGRIRKRLDVPMSDFQVTAEQTVFIGDSPMDAEAARHVRVPFIRVPRSEDSGFSFAALIGGPSKYNSAEFSATLIDRYQRRRPKTDGSG